jgi:hypothetical protein
MIEHQQRLKSSATISPNSDDVTTIKFSKKSGVTMAHTSTDKYRPSILVKFMNVALQSETFAIFTPHPHSQFLDEAGQTS